MTLLPGLRSLVGGPPRLRAVYGSPILIVAGRLDALEQDRGRVEVALEVEREAALGVQQTAKPRGRA